MNSAATTTLLLTLDAIITESCGGGFIQRLARHGVRVIATSATDPLTAVTALTSGRALPEPLPHDHGHEQGQDHGPVTAIRMDSRPVAIDPRIAHSPEPPSPRSPSHPVPLTRCTHGAMVAARVTGRDSLRYPLTA